MARQAESLFEAGKFRQAAEVMKAAAISKPDDADAPQWAMQARVLTAVDQVVEEHKVAVLALNTRTNLSLM